MTIKSFHIRADGQKETYSTEGPVCPNCDHEIVPDEGFFYNEEGYELECGECEVKFTVVPRAVWSWSAWVPKT